MAGSELAERLKAANPKAAIFDGGMVPENYVEKVVAAKPDTVLLIDAAEFGGEVGEWRVFSREELAFTGISTHAGSPRLLAAYLKERTGSEVGLLAIQTGDPDKGNELSSKVAAAVNFTCFATQKIRKQICGISLPY